MEDEGTRPNDVRSIGVFFGPGVARRFLRKEDLGLIVRSHEQVQAGVHWPYGAGRHLVTVFSASNYSGKMQNQGAFALLGSAADAAAAATAARSTAASAAAEEEAAALEDDEVGTPPTPMWKVQLGTRPAPPLRALHLSAASTLIAPPVDAPLPLPPPPAGDRRRGQGSDCVSHRAVCAGLLSLGLDAELSLLGLLQPDGRAV